MSMMNRYKISPRGPYLSCEIGPYRITLMNLGNFALDGGAMFGVVPKVIWNKLLPADELNRIPLATNCLLLEYEDELCFVDAGMGNKWSEKHRDMYGMVFDAAHAHDILHSLAAIGIEGRHITKHLLTHLHFDHAGGATRINASGELVPTFENAEYVVHRGDWVDAHDPTPKSKASYLKENFDPLEASGRLKLLDGDVNEILPGLSFRVTGGHIAHHQILVLDLPELEQGFVFWGDLVPMHHHLRIPYVPAYDLYPIEVMAVKERLLKEAYDKHWLNIFEHDTQYPWGELTWNAEKSIYSLG